MSWRLYNFGQRLCKQKLEIKVKKYDEGQKSKIVGLFIFGSFSPFKFVQGANPTMILRS